MYSNIALFVYIKTLQKQFILSISIIFSLVIYRIGLITQQPFFALLMTHTVYEYIQ